jgi:uncharacterized phage-like protein YoqJ
MKTACFTGHRKIFCDIEDLKSRLYNVLEKAVINAEINDFYNGGAVGWDMLTAEIVMKLREKYPQIRLHMILPCSPENQSYKWTDEQKNTYFSILKQADSIEQIADRYFDGCMKQRNARMIELSDCCFCYWNGNMKSGTVQTIRMAQRKHILIVNFCHT